MTNKRTLLNLTFWLCLSTVSALSAGLAGFYLYLSPKLPDVESLKQIKLQTPLRVFSADGALIGEFGEKRRTPIRFEDAPEPFINAILAAEDNRFYSHHGVDIKGLLRAASQLLRSGHIQTGGSTITMQVARNFFLSNKQTFSRKFNEILLALQIERKLSKEEILELYINKIYLGNRAYGIEAAAKAYYGKPISELSLAQLAMIAGLPKAPSAYNPIVNPSRALVRRNWILGRMLELNYISKSDYELSSSEEVSARKHGAKLDLSAPYVAEIARQKAVDLLGAGAYTDGYSVHTTVDLKLQARAQAAVIDGLITYDGRHGYRGPEAHLEPVTITESGDTNDQADHTNEVEITEVSEHTLTSWQKQLSQFKQVGNLNAAVVIAINEEESAKSIDILFSNGEQSRIDWESGISSARPYINEDKRGPAPKNIHDVLNLGDVIRTQNDEHGTPQLSQIPAAQAALVSLDPNNGAIRALVGGFDFYHSNFNRATQAERQVGSNFKPFIYTAALESGLTPASMINDAPIVFDDSSLEDTWRPENASGQFFGPTRLRQALYKSRNLVSIRILRTIGIKQAIKGMSRYGFEEKQLPHDLSLALGSHAMTPIQLASGYTVFANGGYKVESHLISRIENVEHETIHLALPITVCKDCENTPATTDTPSNTEDLSTLESAMAAELGLSTTNTETTETAPIAPRVMSKPVNYLVNSMLKDVINLGTGRKAKRLGRHDLAGKTGTTNGPHDAWFSGYNGNLVTTTWVGFDNNSRLGRREYGGTAALPIWIDFMELALEGSSDTIQELPEGLVSVRINPNTGKRARANNPDAIFEYFRIENVPQFEDQSTAETDKSDLDSAITDDLF